MQFERQGKAYQIRLQTVDDLRHILTLDEALWMAVSAPLNTLRGDARFFSYLDREQNGRLGVRDVRDAVRWALEALSAPEWLFSGRASLPLTALAAGTDAGRELRSAAEFVLTAAGKPDAQDITVEEVREFLRELRS